MKKPPVVTPDEDVTVVGHAFGAPLVVKGRTWLPLTQVGVWALMTGLSGKPGRSWPGRLAVGFLKMTAILGSEWLHNLAHAAAARLVDRPMDALRVTWGMPLVVYYDLHDPDVTPRQHVARALGGPVLNAALLLPLTALQRRAEPDSAIREVLDQAVGTNAFLSTASLLPIPGIDGGPVLKWTLVHRGRTIEEADEEVKRVDRKLGPVLVVASLIAFLRRRTPLGAILGTFGALATAIGHGLVEE